MQPNIAGFPHPELIGTFRQQVLIQELSLYTQGSIPSMLSNTRQGD